MRAIKKLPRILNAKIVKQFTVSVVFNNGETRLIDFTKVFDQLDIDNHPVAYKLRNPSIFKKFTLENHTLSWKNIIQKIPWGDSFRKVPFEIGADILYSFSKPSDQNHLLQIGKLIRRERLAAGLTQNDLAKRSGTTAGYISRLENDKSDIEIHTLQKVVENGLHKKLEVNFL